MKRFLLLIFVSLLFTTIKAQSYSFDCEYFAGQNTTPIPAVTTIDISEFNNGEKRGNGLRVRVRDKATSKELLYDFTDPCNGNVGIFAQTSEDNMVDCGELGKYRWHYTFATEFPEDNLTSGISIGVIFHPSMGLQNGFIHISFWNTNNSYGGQILLPYKNNKEDVWFEIVKIITRFKEIGTYKFWEKE